MRRAAALALLLAGCDAAPREPAARAAIGDGPALERAAIAAGAVAEPARLDPVGAYAGATDRVCVVRRGNGYRVGAAVSYGEGQGCLARGTASGRATLAIDFGDGCRVSARIDGEEIAFPADLPAACDARCTGRATLDALAAPRLSGAANEAAAMRGDDGRPLCN